MEFPADHPPLPMSIPRPRRAPVGHQRQIGRHGLEITDYRRETGPVGPGSRPAYGRFQNGHPPNRDSFRTAGPVFTPANGQASQSAQEARDYAAAIREAAEREAAAITQDATNRADAITQQATDQAAAIREAAEREAAELRARLDLMSGELGRVAAYVAENLAIPPESAPGPGGGTTGPASQATATTTRPASASQLPASATTTKPRPAAKPARVATTTRPRPARQTGAKPAGRQAKVMRRMVAAFAVVSAIGAITGTAELALHGFPFFILRADGAGAGETGPKEPANPEMPKQAGEVQCSVLHLGCTLVAPTTSKK
ncbi:MAG: hypothetical protein LBV78_00740 [Kitasatospora sp.]|nr:hypothetical protein [Kitasatospora sp.]